MTHSYIDKDWLTTVKCLTVIFACVHSYLSIFLTRIYRMQPHLLQLHSYGLYLFISLNLSCAISSLPYLSGFLSIHPHNHVSTHTSIHPSIHPSTCLPPTNACIHPLTHLPTYLFTQQYIHPSTDSPNTYLPACLSFLWKLGLSTDIKYDNGQTHDAVI